MKKSVLFVSAIAILASAGSVMAYSSTMGPTGGANFPNANVVDQGKVQLAYDMKNTGSEEGVVTNSDNTRLLYGVAKDTEVGLVFSSSNDTDDYGYGFQRDNWCINAKKSFAEKNRYKPAIGIMYSRSKSTQYWTMHYTEGSTSIKSHGCVIYGVVSRIFQQSRQKIKITGSLGTTYSSYRIFDSDIPVNASAYSAFSHYANVDLGLGNGVSLTTEFSYSGPRGGATELVLHCPITKSLDARVAYIDAAYSDDHKPSFGLDYSFSK